MSRFKAGDRVTTVRNGVYRCGAVTHAASSGSYPVHVFWDEAPHGWVKSAWYHDRHLTLENAIDRLARLAP